MTDPTFGVIFYPDDSETQPPSPAEMSVIGLVLPSEDADAPTFPLNTPVAFNSTDAAFLSKLGTGDLATNIGIVNAQLKGIGARIVAVRVTKGASDTATIANIVGDQAGGTGLYALLRAGQLLGVIPRLIGCGRYTGIFTRDAETHDAEANPILAALPAVLEALVAMAYVDGPSTTKQDAEDLRETIDCERIQFHDQTLIVASGETTIEVASSAAALGIQVQRDSDTGGIPAYSVANQPIQGIIGLKRYDAFSLTDGATDAQEMLAVQVGVVVRGELGVESAIADSGYILIAYATCGTDELWRLTSVKRMRDYIHLTMLKSVRKRLAVKINIRGIQAVENDMTACLQDLKTDEYILSGTVGFTKDANTPENLRLGKFRLYFKAEEAPDLIQIGIDSQRDAAALTAMLDTLLAQSSSLVVA